MEFLQLLVDILPTIGFPILCCGALGWFIYKVYTNGQEASKKNMEELQARCKEREDKLYIQLEKQNEINGQFAQIIAQYEIKLDDIKADVKDIKTDIADIKSTNK